MNNDSVCSRAHPPHPPALRARTPGKGSCACESTYSLTIESEPSEVPAIVRLRRLLKAMLRAFAFRCTSIEPAPGSVKSENEHRGAACESCTRTMGTPSQKDPCP